MNKENCALKFVDEIIQDTSSLYEEMWSAHNRQSNEYLYKVNG